MGTKREHYNQNRAAQRIPFDRPQPAPPMRLEFTLRSAPCKESKRVWGKNADFFWDQRLAFLATPKTGSTAIEVALEPLASVAMQRPESLKHLNSGQYRNHLAPLLAAQAGEAFTTIALMRDPLGWLRSWYRFYLRDELDEYAQELRARGFEAFARDYIEDHPSCAPWEPNQIF